VLEWQFDGSIGENELCRAGSLACEFLQLTLEGRSGLRPPMKTKYSEARAPEQVRSGLDHRSKDAMEDWFKETPTKEGK